MPADFRQASISATGIALAWLTQHQRVLDAWGGAGHISGVFEAPWPRLRVRPGFGGSPRQLLHSSVRPVMFDGYTDPAGAPGSAEMERLMLVAALALLELPDRVLAPQDTTVGYVELVGLPEGGAGAFTPGEQQLTSGQIKLSFTARFTLTPGRP